MTNKETIVMYLNCKLITNSTYMNNNRTYSGIHPSNSTYNNQVRNPSLGKKASI